MATTPNTSTGSSRTVRAASTPLRLTLAVMLLAVASGVYVVFPGHNGTALPFEPALAGAPQQLPAQLTSGQRGSSVSFATPSP